MTNQGFRCSNCNSQLDCDTNLLVLGNGNLICNNCSYRCHLCDKKIEDLAILTGNQAFCSNCFSCRNCKKKIDDLRYARTSQGIFCMSCHESLLARKKRHAARKAALQQHQVLANQQLQKQLQQHQYKQHQQLKNHTGNPQSISPSSSDSSTRWDNRFVRSPSQSLESMHTNKGSRRISLKDKSLPSLPLEEPLVDEPPESGSTDFGAKISSNLHISNNSNRDSGNSVLSVTSSTTSTTLSTVNNTNPSTTTSSVPLSSSSSGQDKIIRNSVSSNTSMTTEVLNDRSDIDWHQKNDSEFVPLTFDSNSLSPSDTDYSRSAQLNGDQFVTSLAPSRLSKSYESPLSIFEDENAGMASIIIQFDESTEATQNIVDSDLQETEEHTVLDGANYYSNSSSSSLEKSQKSMMEHAAVSQELTSLPSSSPSIIRSSPPIETASSEEDISQSSVVATPPQFDRSSFSTSVEDVVSAAKDDMHSNGLSIVEDESKEASEYIGFTEQVDTSSSINVKSRSGSFSSHHVNGTVTKEPVDKVFPLSQSNTESEDKSRGKTHIEKFTLDTDVKRNSKIQNTNNRTAIYLNQELSQKSLNSLSESNEKSNNETDYLNSNDYSEQVPNDFNGNVSVSEPLVLAFKENDSDDDFRRLIPEKSLLRPISPAPPPGSSTSVDGGSPSTLRRFSRMSGINSPGAHSFRSRSPRVNSLRAYSPGSSYETASVSDQTNSSNLMTGTSDRFNALSHDVPANNNNNNIGDLATFMSRYSLFDQDPDVSLSSSYDTLTNELIEAKKKIASLERKLHETRAVAPIPNILDDDIQKKRKTVAGLEAQGVVALKELQLLEQAKNGPINTNELVDEFSMELQRVKSQLMEEISDLLAQKEKLVDENTRLEQARDRAVEESSLLNIKNSQLADMNNELTRQLIEKYTKTEKDRGGNSSKRKEPMDMTPSPGNSYGDDPMVTILGGGQVVDTRKSGRKFWKRPGAAVAKGLNRVFATEDSTEEIENIGNPVPNSSGGLGIMFPKDNKYSKATRNGWFKNGNNQTGPESVGMSTSNSSLTLAAITNSPSKSTLGSSIPQKESVLMGAPIEFRVGLENKKIPTIVTKCVEEVEKRGMTFEGIYRKSGGKSQITSIEEAFEKSWDADFDEVLSGDISGVTSALKQYLRYLPIPLITYDAYTDFIACGDIKDVKSSIEKLQYIVHDLPPAHKDCLEFLLKHLAKVTSYASDNLMTSKNLAVVFAPTLARDTTGERELVDMQNRNDCTQLLIEHVDFIFSNLNVL